MADPPPIEWRADAGAEIGPESFGAFDAGVRRGPWALQLATETLDGRFSPELERGKAWVGVRASAFAGGLLLAPWEDGAPAPDHALYAGYAGPDVGAQRWLPHHLWVGGQGAARMWWFVARPSTTAAVPEPTLVATADVAAGWWTPTANASVRAGADARRSTLMPHAALEGHVAGMPGLGPLIDVYAGVAARQDRLTLSRVGGASPYFLPLIGAAAAEFRVENYAIVRAGPMLTVASVRGALFTDLAWLDGSTVGGFGGMVRISGEPWFVDVVGGGAPWLPDASGLPVDVWIEAGVDWH